MMEQMPEGYDRYKLDNDETDELPECPECGEELWTEGSCPQCGDTCRECGAIGDSVSDDSHWLCWNCSYAQGIRRLT